MQQIAEELGDERGVKFEFEAFDIGQLHTLKYLVDQGWVKPPFFIQSVMGFPGGLSATPEHIVHMKQTADELFGDDYHWSCLAAGKDKMSAITVAALLGGHVRVGLEDNCYYNTGKKTLVTNEMLVKRIVRLTRDLERDIATPSITREMLDIPVQRN